MLEALRTLLSICRENYTTTKKCFYHKLDMYASSRQMCKALHHGMTLSTGPLYQARPA